MAIENAAVAVVGAGRMGRGIALSFAIGGQRICVVDLKAREDGERRRLFAEIEAELRAELAFLAREGLMPAAEVESAARCVRLVASPRAAEALGQAKDLVFEAVPETPEAKAAALGFLSRHVESATLIASTSSTMDADNLSEHVLGPERFMNAHWLNPAHIMPLVELSPGAATAPAMLARLKAQLEALGKAPVICKSTPGFIVPRIQALAMNEAARIVAEGVASAEDVDKAVLLGFGLRFSVLGLLEFVDWGGCDILDHASGFLAGQLDPARFAAPDVIAEMVRTGRRGLRDGKGFFDYAGVDPTEYRQQRIKAFLDVLKQRDLAPRYRPAD